MTFDGKGFGEEMVAIVKGYVDREVAPLKAEIERLKGLKSVTEAVIDRDGNLVLTMSDGTTKDMGRVVGKDGKNGDHGAPGVGVDDIDLELKDDGRTVLFTFDGKDIKHSFEIAFPTVIDRGVFKDGTYERGDGVTFGGSFWIAQKDTTEKPGTGDDWRLAVKKGRDGKDKA